MKTKSEKTLPKIGDLITNGGVYRQRVRCGKDPCKCSRGEPHYAYYFFTRHKGKLTKYYVRKADVDHFSKWVRKSLESKQRDRQAVKSAGNLYREFRQALAEQAAVIYVGG